MGNQASRTATKKRNEDKIILKNKNNLPGAEINVYNGVEHWNRKGMPPESFDEVESDAPTHENGVTISESDGSESGRLEGTENNTIPKKYWNKLGFINYDHYGRGPWHPNDDSCIEIKFRLPTHFLGIDCEMVGVGHLKDSALGRVSIVNEWGFCIYDEFVKPDQEITDYRTEFSGIRPEDLANAQNMDQVIKEVKKIVKGKVLVGHSIHNDLEVLDLNDHPQNMIRDTSVFFKKRLSTHQTPSLKSLISKYFKIDIQDGEHSSIQDAQATLKLYMMYDSEWEQNLKERRERANLTHLNLSNQTMAPPIDIADMNICPREKDVFADSKTIFVRENRIIESYSSSEEYIDVQFRLLLEDLFRPLRQGVSDAKTQRYGRKRGNTPKAGTIFNGVRIQGEQVEVKGKKILSVPIERNNLGAIDWEETKLFMNGQLILLSPDSFKSVKFAIITWRPTKNMKTEMYSIPLSVTFARDGPSWITKEGDSFQMMESIAFYEAYKHTLEYLQVVKLDTFPLKKYIVDAEMRPSLPNYLQNRRIHFDFSVFLKNNQTSALPNPIDKCTAFPLDFKNWPDADKLKLDSSQYEAFQKAVTQEFTIIQGPPGTGKTFIGLQVVKFLLSNPQLLNSPILIVSYTNHALDQVLEGLLDFVTNYFCGGNLYKGHQMILRIGGGSKSEIVEPLNLFYKTNKAREQHRYEGQYDVLMNTVVNLKGFEITVTQGILDFLQLPSVVIQQLAIRCKDVWTKWKNELIKIKQNPSSWFGIEKKEKSAKNGKKNRMILMEFSQFERGDSWLLVISKALNQENVANNWDDKSLLEYLLLAFGTNSSEETFSARWALYLSLVQNVQKIVQELKTKALELEAVLKEFKQMGIQDRKDSISSAKVIGMTTTGAVKYKKMVLNSFKSQVMIVEEAAHVLEAHVVASLTQHCQQMIMIGDHKQLRPMTADNSLAKNYKLEISLMERLVQNGISHGMKNWVQLKLQHRMRPEIAQMVCPVIYQELENHPVVFEYPAVRGSVKNLYFIDHRMEEDRELRSSSRINHHEATFLSQLCHYFVTTGCYDQSRITIIATYLDQKTLLQQKLKSLSGCGNVRVSTVDGYQGEENDIILLSLVRSNDAKIVGFLKTDNRVCVALSRARHGLFMMGNMSCLKVSSNTWSMINTILLENKSIGKALQLECPLHDTKTWVSKPEDFSRISCPGCTNQEQNVKAVTINNTRAISETRAIQNRSVSVSPNITMNKNVINNSKPNSILPVATIDSKNKGSDIISPVLQPGFYSLLKLPCGHKYPGKVTSKAIDEIKCIISVMKKLPCGHKQKSHCHQKEETIKCAQWLSKTLPCGHSQDIACDKSSQAWKIVCKALIKKTLECGHSQRIHCNERTSKIKCLKEVCLCPHHMKKVKCHQKSKNPCGELILVNKPCGHEVQVPCNQLRSGIIGMKCQSSVEKSLPCGHRLKVHCHLKETEAKCNKLVEKFLPCSRHQKIVVCHQRFEPLKCRSQECVALSQPKYKPKVSSPSKTAANAGSSELRLVNRCEKIFKCGHPCRFNIHVNENPNHEQYFCIEKCQRSCPNGHVCSGNHQCYKSCPTKAQCKILTSDRLKCGHFGRFQCSKRAAALKKTCDKCVADKKLCDNTLKAFASFKI